MGNISPAMILTACRDSGTSRDVPFFVFGKWTTRRFESQAPMDRISPARIAVRAERQKAATAHAVEDCGSRPGNQPTARISARHSLGETVLVRACPSAGLRTSLTGLVAVQRHSLRAISNTAESNPSSRLTVEGETTSNRPSRHSETSSGWIRSTARPTHGMSRASISSRSASHRAPLREGVTFPLYVWSISLTEWPEAIIPRERARMSASSRVAQTWPSPFDWKVSDSYTPKRRTSTRHRAPRFVYVATVSPWRKSGAMPATQRVASGVKWRNTERPTKSGNWDHRGELRFGRRASSGHHHPRASIGSPASLAHPWRSGAPIPRVINSYPDFAEGWA